METDKSMHHNQPNQKQQYGRFALMLIFSFLLMYLIMYAMVDVWANVIPNLNQFYMVMLMIVPMSIIELLLMGGMYTNKKLNLLLIAISVGIFALSWVLLRQQTGINDKEFLKSMIPHHASALLMCQEASLEDPEIKELCQEILSSQQEQIDQMKGKLVELEKSN